ncbi:MAG: DegT/DnrJ/EryC1/StrS family aminotransferase [Candidatus Altiarchaeota archaeon]|nr:DegT/DnrJ/EryC1/StrS family aminotransferase [Candidatus Altiarchaeota archaeon]
MEIPMSRPMITQEDIDEVMSVLKTPFLSMGPKTDRFEKGFAEYIGTKYGVAVNAGTSALHIAIRALDLKPGEEVITTPFSFIASSNCILYEGGKPVFVDIDPKTLNIDPSGISEAITDKTKAILPVHAFGQPCDMKAVMEIAEDHGLKVIEDACESVGAEYLGKKAGTFGLCSTFAFYPNKQMTTGEGGLLLTDDEDVYRLARSLRNQGRSENSQWLEHERLGYNYRMDEMSAALGLSQLRRIDKILAMRQKVAEGYTKLLSAAGGVQTPVIDKRVNKMSWFVYVARVSPGMRNKLMDELAKRGVPSKPYFTTIHLQPFYRKLFGFKEGDFPVCEEASRSCIALPFFSEMSEDEVIYVCEQVKEIMRG